MLRISKLPWVSLAMMILTYGVFGWLMSSSTQSSWYGGFYIVLIIASLTLPLQYFRTKLDEWMRSRIRSLISLIFGAFVVVILLSWIEVTIRSLVLLAAAVLVRIDLIGQGFSKMQIFFILSISSLGSYGIALLIHQQLPNSKPLETTFLW